MHDGIAHVQSEKTACADGDNLIGAERWAEWRRGAGRCAQGANRICKSGGKPRTRSVSHDLVGETGAEDRGTEKGSCGNRQRLNASFQHMLIFQWLLTNVRRSGLVIERPAPGLKTKNLQTPTKRRMKAFNGSHPALTEQAGLILLFDGEVDSAVSEITTSTAKPVS